MVEDDREEGEMEREVESERRRCERDDGDTGKTMKHKGKHEPTGNQFFIKKTYLSRRLHSSFYRNEEREVTAEVASFRLIRIWCILLGGDVLFFQNVR